MTQSQERALELLAEYREKPSEQQDPKVLSMFEQLLGFELPKSDKYGVDDQTLHNVRKAVSGMEREQTHVLIHAEKDATGRLRLGTDGPIGTTPGFTRQSARIVLAKDPAWTKPVHCEDGHTLSPYVPTDPESEEVEAVADYTPYEPETRRAARLKI